MKTQKILIITIGIISLLLITLIASLLDPAVESVIKNGTVTINLTYPDGKTVELEEQFIVLKDGTVLSFPDGESVKIPKNTLVTTSDGLNILFADKEFNITQYEQYNLTNIIIRPIEEPFVEIINYDTYNTTQAAEQGYNFYNITDDLDLLDFIQRETIKTIIYEYQYNTNQTRSDFNRFINILNESPINFNNTDLINAANDPKGVLLFYEQTITQKLVNDLLYNEDKIMPCYCFNPVDYHASASINLVNGSPSNGMISAYSVNCDCNNNKSFILTAILAQHPYISGLCLNSDYSIINRKYFITCTVNDNFNTMYFNISNHYSLTLKGFDTEPEPENTNPAAAESNAPIPEPVTLSEITKRILSQFN